MQTIIISGFLGAGKTTLIKKLLEGSGPLAGNGSPESDGPLAGRRVALIENDFGEVNVDSTLLGGSGIEIKELNAGCICCTLAMDFKTAVNEIIDTYAPEVILIEPSGVAKLSDIMVAVKAAFAGREASGADVTDVERAFGAGNAVASGGNGTGSSAGVTYPHPLEITHVGTVVDASRFELFQNTFGEFFDDQLASASAIILSHTADVPTDELEHCLHTIRHINGECTFVTTDWDELDGEDILKAMKVGGCEHEHHGHHDHGGECCCHEHHGHHDHEGYEHHHADEIFDEFGIETALRFEKAGICEAFSDFESDSRYGNIIRAKGILPSGTGSWFHFDYVPGAVEIKPAAPAVTGKIAVIGTSLNQEAIRSRLCRG